jgi:hypothetical protein
VNLQIRVCKDDVHVATIGLKCGAEPWNFAGLPRASIHLFQFAKALVLVSFAFATKKHDA